MEGGFKVHETLDKIVVAPLTASAGPEEHLEIDRVRASVAVRPGYPDVLRRQHEGSVGVRSVLGIMGSVSLLAGPYLIVVTRRRLVGRLLGAHDVWCVEGVELLPYTHGAQSLGAVQAQDEERLCRMLQDLLSTGQFFFSYDYDLTLSLQRAAAARDAAPAPGAAAGGRRVPLSTHSDRRFYWNGFVQRGLFEQGGAGVDRFLLPPCIQGSVSLNRAVKVGGRDVELDIISRRGCRRAGPRYCSRGIDADGNVSNFVETEQILSYRDARRSVRAAATAATATAATAGSTHFDMRCHVAALVQVRGSIPLQWSQRPNIRYKPKPRLGEAGAHGFPLRKHYQALVEAYGRDVVSVDLIDQKGGELPLGDCFREHARMLDPAVFRYVPFDFHKECSHMRWDRLSLLLDKVGRDIVRHGFFLGAYGTYGRHLRGGGGGGLMNGTAAAAAAATEAACDTNGARRPSAVGGGTAALAAVVVDEKSTAAAGSGAEIRAGERWGFIVYSRQNGVLRTNCIDCLDRTNVVQSMVAERMLRRVLQQIGVLDPASASESASDDVTAGGGGGVGGWIARYPHLQFVFKNAWADNADNLSLFYAGSGALKTDFTRTGRRTVRGLLRDGYNSALRYYHNNFTDGRKQDALDLLLGKFRVRPGAPSPLRDSTLVLYRFRVIGLVLLAGVVMLLLALANPMADSYSQMFHVALWLLALLVTWRLLLHYGSSFVDQPCLVATDASPMTVAVFS